jgi:hypothetical protein
MSEEELGARGWGLEQGEMVVRGYFFAHERRSRFFNPIIRFFGTSWLQTSRKNKHASTAGDPKRTDYWIARRAYANINLTN